MIIMLKYIHIYLIYTDRWVDDRWVMSLLLLYKLELDTGRPVGFVSECLKQDDNYKYHARASQPYGSTHIIPRHTITTLTIIYALLC